MKRISPFACSALTLLLFLFFSVPKSFSTVFSHGNNDLSAITTQEKITETKSLHDYELELQKEPDNFAVLLNAAYLHLRQGWLYDGKKQRKEHYTLMLKYADRALKLNPTDYRAQLLDIIAKGKTIEYLSPGDQVHRVWILKKDLDALMASHGSDPDLIYVLSWLNFKVGRVNSMQKFFASFLFGGLPEGLTTANALALMKKAITLRPDYNVYYYDLGLFNQRLGNVEKANEYFAKAISIAAQNPEEIIYKQKAEERLQELNQSSLAKN